LSLDKIRIQEIEIKKAGIFVDEKTLTDEEAQKVDGGGWKWEIKGTMIYACRRCGNDVYDNCENPLRTEKRLCDACFNAS
jgi:hypothetical protein